MKKPFVAGEKVAVYMDGATRKTGIVIGFSSHAKDKELHVEFNIGSGERFWAHPKQCRRLVKKERKRVWVQYRDDGSWSNFSIVEPVRAGWVEFVEVKKK